MINTLVHVPPACILPMSYSPCHQFHSHVLGITPCIGFVKHTHPQHLKVFIHVVYIQYGCGMQSMGVCSLNHDTTTSYRLIHSPFFQKITPTCTCNTTMDAPICPSTASQGAKTLCIHPLWMWDAVNGAPSPSAHLRLILWEQKIFPTPRESCRVFIGTSS